MSAPIVSVLMTSYNREKYIGQAMESVLASTLKDFELIIVDDGSKDRTVDIARQYAAKDDRVKIYTNAKNLGDYPNRNQAAAYARGKYLKYVDADDYIYPWGLQWLVEMMEQFPSAGWGLCSLEQYVKQPFPFSLSPKEAYLYNYEGPGLFHKAPLSSIIKKEVFDAVGGFSPIRMAGDFEMWHRLALNYEVVLMPHGIVWYREHGEQEVNSYRRFLKTYEEIKLQYLRDEKNPLGKELSGRILKNQKRMLIKQLMRSLLTLRLSGAKDNFTRLNQY